MESIFKKIIPYVIAGMSVLNLSAQDKKVELNFANLEAGLNLNDNQFVNRGFAEITYHNDKFDFKFKTAQMLGDRVSKNNYYSHSNFIAVPKDKKVGIANTLVQYFGNTYYTAGLFSNQLLQKTFDYNWMSLGVNKNFTEYVVFAGKNISDKLNVELYSETQIGWNEKIFKRGINNWSELQASYNLGKNMNLFYRAEWVDFKVKEPRHNVGVKFTY